MSRAHGDYQALLGSTGNTPEIHTAPLSDPIGPAVSTAHSPPSPRRPRHTYHRSQSSGESDLAQYHHVQFAEEEEAEEEERVSELPQQVKYGRHGLGISRITTENDATSIPRRPVGAAETKRSPRTPRSAESLLSPFSGTTAREGSPSSFRSTDPLYPSKTPDSASSSFGPILSNTELDNLKRSTTTTPIPGNDGGGDGAPGFKCRTRQIYQPRSSWLSITILLLSIYSTIFSGIYLTMAMVKPRYGKRIHSHGDLTPSTASTLSALIAKTIELSFVTVFVSFLGQALSRNAFIRSRGMTIAQMSMRSWIMQPGTLITHWEAVRYAGLSFLGAIALTAAFIAVFYTTAADALVSPKLKFGPVEHRMLYGLVTTSYGNVEYAKDNCQTPIPLSLEDTPDNLQSTCLSMQNVGQAFHNYNEYMVAWAKLGASGNTSSTHLRDRPRPVANLFDNTTVIGAWVEEIDINNVSTQYHRTVNNITMAMPHANVFAAVRNPINNILQPEDLLGLGEYYVTASVPSPAVNVLCATATKKELEPIVYSEWNNGANNKTLNVTAWPQYHNLPDSTHMNYSVHPDLDKLFHFGKENGLYNPPTFPKLPIDWNTVDNTTSPVYMPAVYILGKIPPTVTSDKPYILCSLKSMQYPNCSTTYHASLSGGTLSTDCENGADPLAYNVSQPAAPHGFVEFDWRSIAGLWMSSLSLGTGLSDEQASNSRQLTELVPVMNSSKQYSLNPNLPSIAEALAVQAGSTLLMSSTDAPFIHFWNYSQENSNILKAAQLQGFNATLRTQDYSSGGAQRWQGLFYVVLILVFATNCFCLIYLVSKGGQITDYTEPQNLFTLAVNSPPSRLMARSCGSGPKGEQFKRRWVLEMKEGEEHFYARCLGDEFAMTRPEDEDEIKVRSREGGGWEVARSETTLRYERLVRAKVGFSLLDGLRWRGR